MNLMPWEPPGLILTGQFIVEIKGAHDRPVSALPLLYVASVAHSADRHFYIGGAACLCSPLEADEFLRPFDLKKFLDQLVIPFLYGQLYFDLCSHWPWADYAHGATGVLEAYARIQNPTKAGECVTEISQDFIWPRIKAALVAKSPLKGHSLCFCGKRNHVRRCHPEAWQGFRRLYEDLKANNVHLG